MRYQEPIYIQNENSGVRNKDILNVNMSSDICIFDNPRYDIVGASKLDCTGSTSGTSYVLTADTQSIPFTFNFTANTDTFLSTNALFRFELFKYIDSSSAFTSTNIYKSNSLDYSGFSATNTTTQYVPVSGLSLDGEYIIKPFYHFDICTDFLGRLNKTIDTSTYISGTEYGIYDNNQDYYFIAVKQAEIPLLTQNISNLTEIDRLRQQVVIPIDEQITFNIENGVSGDFILTLNGLVLAPNIDYSFTGNTIFLSGKTYSDDILTIIYSNSGNFNLIGDNLEVTPPIISGITNNQGSNLVYFNTTTNKFEIYTSVTPQDNSTIIVMLNGATLANGVDYYQSITNQKRIILEGLIMVGDIITIVYYPKTSTINGLITNNPIVSWEINTPPTKDNGFFTLEVGNDNSFSSLYYTGVTDYNIGVGYYNQSFIASGNVGTTLYYRVKNEKNYTTICGDIINSVAYSETIPIVIQTNSINSY